MLSKRIKAKMTYDEMEDYAKDFIKRKKIEIQKNTQLYFIMVNAIIVLLIEIGIELK